MEYKYELVKVGGIPTWDKAAVESFQNPVHVGDKVKGSLAGSNLLRIVDVEHYPTVSVLYFTAAK